MGRQGAGVGLGRAASPDVAVEVALIVDGTAVAGSRVGAHVVVALVVFVGISLRTLGLG